MIQKSDNFSVQRTLKIRRRFLRNLCNFIKIIWNEILRVQCSTHNAVIPLCNKYVSIPVNTREYYR